MNKEEKEVIREVYLNGISMLNEDLIRENDELKAENERLNKEW